MWHQVAHGITTIQHSLSYEAQRVLHVGHRGATKIYDVSVDASQLVDTLFMSLVYSHFQGLRFAVASADELHASPLFGWLVWLLFAFVNRHGGGSAAPRRAIAASQLALSLVYSSGAQYLLLPMLVLAMVYLRAAAFGAQRIRAETHEVPQLLRRVQQRERREPGGASNAAVDAAIAAGNNGSHNPRN